MSAYNFLLCAVISNSESLLVNLRIQTSDEAYHSGIMKLSTRATILNSRAAD